MAQSTDTKLFIALGVLAVLGGGLYLQTKNKEKDKASHSLAAATVDLPKFSLSEEATKKISRVVIEQPEKKGETPKPAAKHELVKEGEQWLLASPVKAKANAANLDSLLKNLAKLSIKERVSADPATYERYELTDALATHVVAYEGDKPIVELWLGKSGGRGQMARVKDQPGAFLLEGYSNFLYARDTKGWRDLSIFTLEPEKAVRVEVENETGAFAFKKEGTTWKGEFKKAKTGAFAALKEFDGAKVDELLRAYKTLSAADFGDGKTLEDAGLSEPKARLVISLDGGEKRELMFGSNAEGSSRWARLPSSEQIFAVSSWAADWAFSEETKFQKKKDEKKSEE